MGGISEKRLIDLDLAIAKVKDDGLLGTGYSDSERIDDVCDMLESCPTVDAVEVVHGLWIAQDAGLTRFKCSCCEKGNFGGHENYCPNCGAKMDLED